MENNTFIEISNQKILFLDEDHFHSEFPRGAIFPKLHKNFLGLSDLLISDFQKNMNHQQLDIYQKPGPAIKSEQSDTCQEISSSELLQVGEMTVYQLCMF